MWCSGVKSTADASKVLLDEEYLLKNTNSFHEHLVVVPGGHFVGELKRVINHVIIIRHYNVRCHSSSLTTEDGYTRLILI